MECEAKIVIWKKQAFLEKNKGLPLQPLENQQKFRQNFLVVTPSHEQIQVIKQGSQ